jgi:hypothetical protein
MPNQITTPDPYEKLGDGSALKASRLNWAQEGFDGFLGFAVKFNEEGKGWDFCEDCICDDNCNELEKTETCFNLGATPISFYATRAGEVAVDLKEDTTARSRQWERYNNPNFKPFTPEEDILEGTTRPLNIRNITQVITNANGDFIDTDYINQGFERGFQIVPTFNTTDEDENPVYRFDGLVGGYDLPTFDDTYECQKYPHRVKSQYWVTEKIEYIDEKGDTQSYTRLLDKINVTIDLGFIDSPENRVFTFDKEEGKSLKEVFEDTIKGKLNINISIETGQNNLTWSSNKAKVLSVNSSNTLLTKETDGDISASDTWEIRDSYIKANLKYFKIKTGAGLDQTLYANSGYTQNEAIPNFNDNFEVAGQYDVYIGLENKDIFSVLARRFFINIIYSLNDAENCEPEIRVEGLDNVDGFTDQKKFKATPDHLNTYDFKLDNLSFIERNYYGDNNDGVIDIQLSNNDEPLDIIRVKTIEVVANLNWLRKLEEEQTLEVYAKGGAYCPLSFRLLVSTTPVDNANQYINYYVNNNTDLRAKEIYEIYGDEVLPLPNLQTQKVAEIVFNKDELNLNPTQLDYTL